MGMAVVIAGPRDCGKRMLIMAMRRNHPDLDKRILIVPMYNSRRPYPNEIQGDLWFFRQRQEIDQIASQGRIIVAPMRQGNVVGVDPYMIAEAAMEKDAIVMIRVAAIIGAQLAGHPALKGTALRSVFLSPVSMKDINTFKAGGANNPDKLKQAIHEFMKARIRPNLPIARRLGQDISTFMEQGINDIFEDLGYAPSFTDVLVNPEVMGGNHWLADNMPKDSAKVLNSFAAIMRGNRPECSEQWPSDLISGMPREEQIRTNFRPRGLYTKGDE